MCGRIENEETVLTSRTLPYHQGYHRYLIFLAVAVLFLILAGALVTSNEAGLSVPDWPTSFGSLYKIPPMVGGVKYEHSHRMIAEFIGLLVIGLAIWTQRIEQRKWMRVLGWIALFAVIGQGIIGGVGVRLFLPWAITTAHSTLAQTIFCAVIAMALFTSKDWLQPSAPIVEQDLSPSTPFLTSLAAGCVWVQLILGAAFRNSGIKLLPHLIGACVVTAVLFWTIARVLGRYRDVPHLRRPAQLLLGLLVLQLCLGFAAYMTRMQWGNDPEQWRLAMVLSTVSHVVGGALVLGTSVVLAIQSRRMITTHAREVVANPTRKAIIA